MRRDKEEWLKLQSYNVNHYEDNILGDNSTLISWLGASLISIGILILLFHVVPLMVHNQAEAVVQPQILMQPQIIEQHNHTQIIEKTVRVENIIKGTQFSTCIKQVNSKEYRCYEQ